MLVDHRPGRKVPDHDRAIPLHRCLCQPMSLAIPAGDLIVRHQ